MQEPKRLTDRKRDAILKAAVAEFRAAGFDATSMDKIAAAAEVSKRTVYNHFPSKDELFATILVELWKQTAQAMDLGYRKDRPLREQLIELMKQKMAMLADPNVLDLMRVAVAAAVHSPERAQAIVARIGEKEEGVLAWLRAAHKDGKFKGVDLPFAALQLQAMVKGLAFWPQIGMGQAPLSAKEQKQVIEGAVDMFLSHYG